MYVPVRNILGILGSTRTIRIPISLLWSFQLLIGLPDYGIKQLSCLWDTKAPKKVLGSTFCSESAGWVCSAVNVYLSCLPVIIWLSRYRNYYLYQRYFKQVFLIWQYQPQLRNIWPHLILFSTVLQILKLHLKVRTGRHFESLHCGPEMHPYQLCALILHNKDQKMGFTMSRHLNLILWYFDYRNTLNYDYLIIVVIITWPSEKRW